MSCNWHTSNFLGIICESPFRADCLLLLVALPSVVQWTHTLYLWDGLCSVAEQGGFLCSAFIFPAPVLLFLVLWAASGCVSLPQRKVICSYFRLWSPLSAWLLLHLPQHAGILVYISVGMRPLFYSVAAFPVSRPHLMRSRDLINVHWGNEWVSGISDPGLPASSSEGG